MSNDTNDDAYAKDAGDAGPGEGVEDARTYFPQARFEAGAQVNQYRLSAPLGSGAMQKKCGQGGTHATTGECVSSEQRSHKDNGTNQSERAWNDCYEPLEIL